MPSRIGDGPTTFKRLCDRMERNDDGGVSREQSEFCAIGSPDLRLHYRSKTSVI
jgi:hypothetical protein